MALALVARMPSLVEAHIAVGALRSGGIAAEMFDANFGGVEAPVIEALGGFRIMAPEDEAASARQILRTLRADAGLTDAAEQPEAEPGSPWRPAPTWRRWLAAALAVFTG